MKKVFTNSEIVHAFNMQDQPEGRTANGSMYFYDKKIYSYGNHYLLGEFTDSNTIIINDKGYSNTTARHISLLRDATRDKRQFFTTQIEADLVLDEIKNLLGLLSRTRLKASFYNASIDRLFKSYFEYIDFKKMRTKAKKDPEHREILRLFKSFYNNSANLLEDIKVQDKKERERKTKETQKKLKDWRTFKTSWFRNQTQQDYLRVDRANNIIETSQNVKISIEEGKRLLKLIKAKNIVGQKVDNRYIVRAFDSMLKIGCHNITIKEINRLKL